MVEMGKEFSSENSGKFLNGVLDKARKQIARPALNPPFKFARFGGGAYWLIYADAFGSKANRSYFSKSSKFHQIKWLV